MKRNASVFFNVMSTDLIERIKSVLPKLSKGHRAIGSYIIEHCETASYMTATKLGEVVGVSESTVVRFANELGFRGYPEFRHSLQSCIRSKLTSMQRIAVSEDIIGEADIVSKVMLADIENLRSSVEAIDREVFEKTVEAICSARRIYVTGCRASSMLSWFMTYYLNLVMPNVTNVKAASSDEMFQEIIRISADDVMIGISFPRYSHRTKTALEFAKDRGAKVISITDCENSPLVQCSDFSLFAKSDMASFVDSLIAPLSVINALIVAIGRKKKDSLAATFKDLEEIWEEYEVYEKPKG